MRNYWINCNTKACTLSTTLRRSNSTNLALTFHIDVMIINNISVSFISTQPLKHSRDRTKLDTFEYWVYEKANFSIVTGLKE